LNNDTDKLIKHDDVLYNNFDDHNIENKAIFIVSSDEIKFCDWYINGNYIYLAEITKKQIMIKK
jgi:hypothetical protein